MASQTWAWIHQERSALADDLTGLTDGQWATPSLCSEWSVQQALGHIVSTARMTPPKFLLGMAGAGFRFPKFVAKGVAEKSRGSGADTLAEFRQHLTDTSAPPGPLASWIGEIVIHSTDIRRPLGIPHQFSGDQLQQVADFYRGSNLIVGAKKRIAGLRLAATDADWTSGDGAEVRGPLLSLVQVMTGRGVALADLTGDGVATLRSRIGA